MKSMIQKNHELIVTIVEKGIASDVVKYAKKAGAEGSTIMYGRGTGIHDEGLFLGMTIEPEKEIILTLVPDHILKDVVQSISKGVDIDRPGNGVCFVVDVSKVIGIPHRNLTNTDEDDSQ